LFQLALSAATVEKEIENGFELLNGLELLKVLLRPFFFFLNLSIDRPLDSYIG